ncbi:MAG TPA: hypothetical protein VM406_08130 [Noviherbaspirillum sp.]|nr:hypothetical protein [Noviherbaspirillum sp.]
MQAHPARKFLPLLLVAALSACGGGSSDTPSGNPPFGNPPGDTNPPPGGTNPPPQQATPMTMHCVDGTDFQCSGATVLRVENGVALTDSGVQVYGISTSDLDPGHTVTTRAWGLRPASGGPAEVRVRRNAEGSTSAFYLLLRNLGLSWDGVNERPPIFETFNPTQGRVELDANGRITFVPLPDSSDLAFYDYATLGRAATQARYANNRYFPRENNPPRCPGGPGTCASTETDGVRTAARPPGSWHNGGLTPDFASVQRFHSDGDVHAGDGPPDANGNRTWLPGGTGFGIPFPASKGYRDMTNWSYRYANLATWTTQDTVVIAEWATTTPEHNKLRRGVVSFGDVTPPAEVPTVGSATYTGIAYGWYAGREDVEELPPYWGTARVEVNFATRTAVVTIQDTNTYDGSGSPVPAAFTAALAGSGDAEANYLTGSAAAGMMNGGISARLYGPSAGMGTAAPAEVGGAFMLTHPATGQTIMGGFLGRRQ